MRSSHGSETADYVGYVRGSVTDSNLAANALSMRTTLLAWERSVHSRLDSLSTMLDVDRHELGTSIADISGTVLDKADDRFIASRAALQEARRELDEFQAPKEGEEADPEESSRAQAVLRAAQRHLSDLEEELAEIDGHVEEAERRELGAKMDYDKKSSRNEEYLRKQVVQTLLADTASIFDAIAEEMRRFGRTDFQRALNEIYGRIINKPYVLEVADNFTVPGHRPRKTTPRCHSRRRRRSR